MFAQSLENYNRKGTGEPARRRTTAVRRGQHHAQELPSIYPRVDHERTKTREQ
jgi:hypothetical protein